MLLDRVELGVCERFWLVENSLGDADLADIMEQAAHPQQPKLRPAHAEVFADRGRQIADLAAVSPRVGVLGLKRVCQRRDHRQVLAFERLCGVNRRKHDRRLADNQSSESALGSRESTATPIKQLH